MSVLKKVVLIDDDQVNNFVCESIIRSERFADEVVSFEWAEDALAYLKKSVEQPAQSFPDLIFLDINMPGMDGWSFIDEYRQLPKEYLDNCCLFMLSSAVDRKDIISAKSYEEVKDFFSKPLSPEILSFIKDEFITTTSH